MVKDRLPQAEMYEPKTHRRSSPDLIILVPGGWAALEFKRDEDAEEQANQSLVIDRLSAKGYAKIVYPVTALEVLDELENLFPLAR